jgi:glycosyltransferase involved in cell wall biosynthesis
MPVRDEARDLEASVAAVLAQDYPGRIELVLSLAPSHDGTEEIAARLAGHDSRVRLVPNPSGTIPAGLNAGLAAASADVVVRVDGHAVLPGGYLRRAVELLAETGADNVGGVQRAHGTTALERAVAAAMRSRFGVGDARFRYGGRAGPAETVYLGAFRRGALQRVGGYDESLLRNEDYELNHRLRVTGGTVYFSPELGVSYRPRGSLLALARQYGAYGRWKAVMLRRHPRSLRWRQAVPPAAVLANAGGLALGLGGRHIALAAPASYLAALTVACLVCARTLDRAAATRLPAVFAVMHHAWGGGFLSGWLLPPRTSQQGSVVAG